MNSRNSYQHSDNLTTCHPQIDRMMEEFATVYCQANAGVYSKSDTCYVLAFSIIMLNTSLHNPSVKDKLTADQFVKMNNG